MTKPRKIEKGAMAMSTRRTGDRRFLLRPEPRVNQILEYSLAESAQKTGVQIFAFMMMSNHYHAVLRDDKGRVSDFLQRFHMLSAKALNCQWGRFEGLWSSEQAGLTNTINAEDALDKVIYTLANPIRAGLVTKVADWPGLHSFFLLAGEKKIVKRPKGGFFAENGDMPEEVELTISAPPGYTNEEWNRLVRERIAEVERSEEAERARHGKKVLGRKAVRRQSHKDRAVTHEQRWKLIPRIACKDKWSSIAAIQALKTFWRLYAKALERFRSGVRDVVFPAGTWMMAQRYGVSVAPS